ncbi:Recombination protein RecR [bacterium HR20]|jgi:recombination protein RecR|nr:Recombination protein RecR [bacterium HR20]GIV49694.1 MAG: recombination protein RecR [Candidatus Kapabacteria bacterium]
MTIFSPAIERAIEALSSLPTIGRKSAQRLVFHLLRQPNEQVQHLADALVALKASVRYCSMCFTFTEQDPCTICTSPNREREILCVVEQPSDVFAIERTGEYRGLYHVLHGSLDPLRGVGVEQLKIEPLIERVRHGGIAEVIFALNPTVEGEVTTHYLTKALQPFGVRLTRIARGVPVGMDLEFADEATLSRALAGRSNVQ